ncbi:hypothetical protein M8J77_020199 [Diaphorina citri]|nr:hypothetical protein M8J77_020199 [Diaphorina citri]
MFDGLREKVHSVQENFSSSFRILNVSDGSLVKKSDVKNIHAGGDMLHKCLTQWNELHTLSEENAHKAHVADEKINAICNHTNLQLSQMMKLCFSLNLLPKLVDKTKAVINQTKSLEVLFQDIENSLTYLEEIVIIQKVQETQLERRFKLAMHKENKLKHLETLRGSLERNYNEEVKSIEEKKAILSKERQKTFEEAFKQDLEIYKQSGNLNVITNKVNYEPKVSSLEDVELEVDDAELNKMLTDT